MALGSSSRDEIVRVAKHWPKSFRARLEAGTWHLDGAGDAIQQEFAFCAERVGRELKFPMDENGPVTNFLYRLKVQSSHVVRSQPRGPRGDLG